MFSLRHEHKRQTYTISSLIGQKMSCIDSKPDNLPLFQLYKKRFAGVFCDLKVSLMEFCSVTVLTYQGFN